MSKRHRKCFPILIIGSFLFFVWTFLQSGIQRQLSVNILDKVRNSVKNAYYPEIALDYIADEYDTKQASVLRKVRAITNCLDRPLEPTTRERGQYWVLYNYMRANRSHSCHETVTYTTHGDYTFLDNLVPLLKRWNGPISIALYAPGTDFNRTLESIAYLRDCTDPSVKELVTFHIYFPKSHLPNWVPQQNNLSAIISNCSSIPPYQNVSQTNTYKSQEMLLYPINVGRNIARETAQTHFILASDIELYPSLGVIPQFLSMIANNEGPLLSNSPKVFPLNIFEVSSDAEVPENKTTLLKMLRNGKAITFHKRMCPLCHSTPHYDDWQKLDSNNSELHVFYVGKRDGKFGQWEPIFIGTHADPLYDERLTWEGKSDKMSQAYAMCVLDYEFLILDNAFLVHKPGMKKYIRNKKRDHLAYKTNQNILPLIRAELTILFGRKKGCVIRK